MELRDRNHETALDKAAATLSEEEKSRFRRARLEELREPYGLRSSIEELLELDDALDPARSEGITKTLICGCGYALDRFVATEKLLVVSDKVDGQYLPGPPQNRGGLVGRVVRSAEDVPVHYRYWCHCGATPALRAETISWAFAGGPLRRRELLVGVDL